MQIECPIDTPGQVNWCQIWPGNTQGSRCSQLALCIQWLFRQTIKLRRENIVWDLKKHVEVSEMSTYKCRLIRKIVYRIYRDRIRDYVDISGVSRYPMSR